MRSGMPFQKLYWCVVGCLLLGSCCTAEAEDKAKDYVDTKNGFRLTIPPGWRQFDSSFSMPGFRTKDKKITLVVIHLDLGTWRRPETFWEDEELDWARRNYKRISQETIPFSGLTATKSVYTGIPEDETKVIRRCEVIVLTQEDVWSLDFAGPDDLLNSAQSPRVIEIEGMIQSFQFLEPLLSSLKAGLWKPSSRIETRTVAGSSRRYFASDKLEMSILLPEGWEKVREQPPSFSQPAQVVLGKVETLAGVSLTRQVLEASPSLFLQLEEDTVESNFTDVTKISEEKTTVDGMEAVRRVRLGKRGGVKYRSWTLIMSRGNMHYLVGAFAPDEVFEKYVAEFTEMMGSVQFVGEK